MSKSLHSRRFAYSKHFFWKRAFEGTTLEEEPPISQGISVDGSSDPAGDDQFLPDAMQGMRGN